MPKNIDVFDSLYILHIPPTLKLSGPFIKATTNVLWKLQHSLQCLQTHLLWLGLENKLVFYKYRWYTTYFSLKQNENQWKFDYKTNLFNIKSISSFILFRFC